MLADHPMFPTLPASDLERARAFYSEQLGLEPSQLLPGGTWSTNARGPAST
jgi:catechol 2,3-dioxygenase-like lactoylglutathione lyase family enzyme